MIYIYGNFYIPRSYGIVCMYEMAYLLNSIGFETKLLCSDNERYDFLIPEKLKKYYISKAAIPSTVCDEDIVIYPETIPNNPLNAKRVIRWLMNKPCFLTGTSVEYGPQDVLLAYSNYVNSELPQMFCMIDERKLFSYVKENWGVHRKKSMVTIYFGKVHNSVIKEKNKELEDILSVYDDVNIITRAWPKNRIYTLGLVAESDLLISYDCLTNLNYEATLVGTPVLMMDDTYNIQEKRYNVNNSGFAFAVEDIPIARKNVPTVYQDYCNWICGQDKQIKATIEWAINKIISIETNQALMEINDEFNRLMYMKDAVAYEEICSAEPFSNIDEYEQIPEETINIIRSKHRSITQRGSRLARIFEEKAETKVQADVSNNVLPHEVAPVVTVSRYKHLPSWRIETYHKVPGDLTTKELLFLFGRRMFKGKLKR